jgi:hypothetical protein
MATVPAAYPFIEVKIDTSGLRPVATRSPGVIAVVGKTAKGSAAVNTPFAVDTLDQAAQLFAMDAGDKLPAATPLYTSLQLAFLQDPSPSKIYGVRVDTDKYADALASLEAVDDVTFVSLANEVLVGAVAVGATPASDLVALKQHVENMSAQGHKRIGVAMVDPARPKTNTYVTDVTTATELLNSDVSRMILIAARAASGDAATAAMAAIAGYAPQISMVLKKVNGITMPTESQYSPTEIKGLSEANINPLVSPSLIVGGGLYFGEGRCYTTDASKLYIDIVRVLDDIDFRLRAGLIGLVGDARITKAGMTQLKVAVEGILGPLQRSNEIADFSVTIPVLSILSVPESTLNPTDASILKTARANRIVDMLIDVTYGPAVHRLSVTLALKF